MLSILSNPIIASCLLIPIMLAAAGRPRDGLWLTWACVFCLFPGWLDFVVTSGLILSIRQIAPVGFLIGALVCARPGPKSTPRLVDLAAGAMIASIAVAEVTSGDVTITTIPSILFLWLVPYLVGRRFFATGADVGRFARLIAPLIALQCSLAIVETFSKTNLYHHLFAHFSLNLEKGEAFRLGLRRAHVNSAEGPIFFAILTILTYPWAAIAARGGPSRRPGWRRALPALSLAACVCTLSRGPIAAWLGAASIGAFFRFPRWRRLIGGALVSAFVGVFVLLPMLIDVTDSAISEENTKTYYIKVNGRDVVYTGARHRILIHEAYAQALDDAGMFGFGIMDVSKVHDIYHIDPMLWSIESHYIIHQLGSGLIGLVSFDAFAAVMLLGLSRLAWRDRGPLGEAAGLLAGAQLVTLLIILGVFFAEDVRTLWIFNAGLLGNLLDIERREGRPAGGGGGPPGQRIRA